MASVIASDPLVTAAFAIGLVALALSAGLVLAVLLLRFRLNARRARESGFAATWRPLLAACVEAVPADLPPLAREDAAQFLLLWTHAQESLLGDARERLLALARRLGADRYAVELVGSRQQRERLLALAALSHLGLPSTGELAGSLLKHPSPVLSLVAARAYLRHQPAAGLPRVLELVARRDDWPTQRVSGLLIECGPAPAGAALVAAIEAALASPGGDAALARLLRLVGVAHLEVARPVLERVFESSGAPETIAAALAALAHPEDARWARTFAAHGEWYVRVAAARALGRLGTADDREILAAMLRDPSWWVRYRAAEALAGLPGMSPRELRRLADELGDRYGAEALAQVLSERAVA